MTIDSTPKEGPGRLFTIKEVKDRADRYLRETKDRVKANSWQPRSKYSMSVGALILARDTKRFLLGKRGPTIEDPNVWGTFGGGVDTGESLEGALKRELFEEAGYRGPIDIQPLYTFSDQKTGFKYFNHLAVIPAEFTPHLNFETSEVKWFDWGKPPNPLHPGVQRLFDDRPSRVVIESSLLDLPIRGLSE